MPIYRVAWTRVQVMSLHFIRRGETVMVVMMMINYPKRSATSVLGPVDLHTDVLLGLLASSHVWVRKVGRLKRASRVMAVVGGVFDVLITLCFA